MDLDLGLIPSFLVLIEEGHYGRAATRQHLTSSALTRRIQRLERQVGVPLVERSSAGVIGPTAAGERFAVAAAPLVAQAAAARRSARSATPQDVVRLGVPAATNFHQRIDLAGMARRIRLDFPQARLACIDVPFPMLDRCLGENRVDVLCTITPVRDASIDSIPLGVTSRRIGVVGERHPLAEAGTVDVDVFAAEPMLFNPRAPAAWMSPFWLEDVRSRREARLVAIDAEDQQTVLRETFAGHAVIATLATLGPNLGSQLHAVTLSGSAPVVFHIAHRHGDRRGPVQALVEAFQRLSPRDLA